MSDTGTRGTTLPQGTPQAYSTSSSTTAPPTNWYLPLCSPSMTASISSSAPNSHHPLALPLCTAARPGLAQLRLECSGLSLRSGMEPGSGVLAVSVSVVPRLICAPRAASPISTVMPRLVRMPRGTRALRHASGAGQAAGVGSRMLRARSAAPSE